MYRERTQFTQRDDDNLCWYISRRVPYPEDGGRFSDGIWKELLAAVRSLLLVVHICFNDWLIQAEFDQNLRWAKRHTIQSWRERYRKRAARFDPIIAKYVKENPPEPTALYGLSRKYNKDLDRGLRFVQCEDIVRLTEESAAESEESSDEEMESKVQRPSQFPEKLAKAVKRQHVESADESPSGLVAKRKKLVHLSSSSPDRSRVRNLLRGKDDSKEVGAGTPGQDQDRRGSLNFLPARSQESIRNPMAMYQADIHSTSPIPSPTLVQRTSQAIPSSISTRHIDDVANSSLRLSTSFRNVAHSSPALNDTGSNAGRIIRSHNTSVTEPSSRSVLVPPQLPPSGNTTNAPAEPSITRESLHKPSSPNSQPLPLGNASRKLTSHQPPGHFPSDDEEDGQGTQWAPYKNTRSRSKSIEPVSLPVLREKRRERITRRKGVVRNETLEPVYETEVEHEQVGQSLINATVTETMREEQNVANLLVPNPDALVSGTHFRASIGQAENNGNSSQGGDVERTFHREKGGREEGIQRVHTSEEVESIDNKETAELGTVFRAATKSLKFEHDGKEEDGNIHDISNSSESEGGISPEEDISSDDQATQQQFLSTSLSRQPRLHPRSSLSSDDEKTDQEIDFTPAEVLDLFDSPHEDRRSQEQRLQSNDFRTENPTPLRSQSQRYPEQSLPVQTSLQVADVHTQARPFLSPTSSVLVETTPVNRAIQSLPDEGRSNGLSSSSTSVETRRPIPPVNSPTQGRSSSQMHPSIRHSIPLSQQSQLLQSHTHGRRRASGESTSSESQDTFPMGGTRASVFKQQLEQELKESPYTPPTGTRAARVAKRNL